MPMWTAKEARELCVKIEAIVKPLGCHTALGGGCLIRGESDKDVDVFIYPANTNNPIEPGIILTALGALHLDRVRQCRWSAKSTADSPQAADNKLVFCGWLDGKRIDLFFVQ